MNLLIEKFFLSMICLLIGYDTFAVEIITEKNWLNHPEIVEVRILYQAINASKDAGILEKKERNFIYCEPYEDTERVLYTDGNGKARIYSYGGGSDDSVVNTELYYDEKQQLRFAFITAGTYFGTQIEHRVYFSKTGKRIWEIQKLLKGPNYFPKKWPEAKLIQKPVDAFNSKNLCSKEVK